MALTDNNQTFIDRSAIFLEALANPQRLSVLFILLNGEQSVGRLSEKIGISQSALSQHLAKLRAAGVVTTRRDAQQIFYSCSSTAVHVVLEALGKYFADPLPKGKERLG